MWTYMSFFQPFRHSLAFLDSKVLDQGPGVAAVLKPAGVRSEAGGSSAAPTPEGPGGRLDG